jgi:hypothetical protein
LQLQLPAGQELLQADEIRRLCGSFERKRKGSFLKDKKSFINQSHIWLLEICSPLKEQGSFQILGLPCLGGKSPAF